MPTLEAVGEVVRCNLTRSEDDDDDLTVHLTNPDGTDATVVGWTAILSVGADADHSLSPAVTFNGLGISGGFIVIEMTGFDLPIGSYKYDIRITDTVTGDSPSRVYFKGSYKVTTRIN